METLLKALAELTTALVIFNANAQVPLIASSIQTNEIVEAKQENIIDRLALCESGKDGKPRWDIKVLDTNKKYSYGGLQFQLQTFKHYGQKYGIFGDITDEAAERLIFREDLQRIIATKMLQDGETWHWKICYAKIIK